MGCKNKEGGTHHMACECREAEFRAIESERDLLKAKLAVAIGALEEINKIQVPNLDKYMEMRTAQLGGILAVCFGITRDALAKLSDGK